MEKGIKKIVVTIEGVIFGPEQESMDGIQTLIAEIHSDDRLVKNHIRQPEA